MEARFARQEPIIVLGRLNFWSNIILLKQSCSPLTHEYLRYRIALSQFRSAQEDSKLEINEITGVN